MKTKMKLVTLSALSTLLWASGALASEWKCSIMNNLGEEFSSRASNQYAAAQRVISKCQMRTPWGALCYSPSLYCEAQDNDDDRGYSRGGYRRNYGDAYGEE